MEAKKKFNETGFGKFLSGVIHDIPSLAGDIADIALSGNPTAALIGKVSTLLRSKGENNLAANKALKEIELSRGKWELEAYELELKDKERASKQYAVESSMANKIASKIITNNLMYIFMLLVCQIIFSYLSTTFIEDKTIAVSIGGTVGTVIGTVIGSLLQERNQVIGFFFGSSIKNIKSE